MQAAVQVTDLAQIQHWLWHRSAAAALIQPVAYGLPYAAGIALKRKKKKVHKASNFSIPLPAYLLFWLMAGRGLGQEDPECSAQVLQQEFPGVSGGVWQGQVQTRRPRSWEKLRCGTALCGIGVRHLAEGLSGWRDG